MISIEAAVRRLSPTVERLLAKAGVVAWDREDALQDVLAIFAERFARIEPDCHRAFLVTTARRVAAERRRRQGSSRLAPSDVGLDAIVSEDNFRDAGSLDGVLDLKRAHGLAVEALTAMPAQERALFVAARWRGHARSRLAAEFCLAPGTVASRLARAEGCFWMHVKRVTRQTRPA